MDKSILRQWLATILIVVICPLLATAQNQTTVNISAKDTPVKTVLRQIESQTTYRFSYTAGLLDGFPRQTLEYNNTPVATVLDKVFGNSPIAYDIVSPKAIALYKRGAEPRKTTKGTKDGKTVKGQILDSTGEPVIGATVWIKGTQKRMATNIDGEYSFADVEPGQEIVVTSVGYDPTSIAVGDKETYNLTLDSSANNLDEVVVVGYGAQKKINLTGSVATVKSKQLESRAATNLSNALAGVASGVSVSQTSGKPGSDGSNITIRGIGTFNSSYLAPLVIVDGSEASIGSVNSDDVESISVLKDAASAAIYGSRGANGVILITTKKGRKGQAPTVTYTGLITNSKMSGKAFRFEDNYAEYMEMANRWNPNRNY
ncbi:MAG: TonB-dependent receptor plug domain-containing protein, partial [Candidatus Amulumruptor sp.]|nr:TonB-dependent receptor plug domain-containing protein [Candidatus Amulumruptor sp.]